MTYYPTGIDNSTSLPPATGDDAIAVNALIEAVIAIEIELGISPAGAYASVRTRLDILETRIGSIGGGFVAGGDLGGSITNQIVIGIGGVPLNLTAPTTGQILTFNGSQWAPANVPSGFTAAGDLSGTSTNQTVVNIQGVPIISTGASPGQVLTFNGSHWSPANSTGGAPSGAAGGDLGNTYPNPSVVALRGTGVSNTVPSTGNLLTFNGSNWSPNPLSGDIVGPYNGTLVFSIQGITVSNATPSNGSIFAFDGANWSPNNLAGDVTGGFNATVVGALQGFPVSNANPGDGQVLTWIAANSDWEPANAGAGPAGGDLTGNYPNPTVASLSNTGTTSTVALNIKSLIWGTTIVSPSISQADDPTLPISNSLTIQAQNNTGEGVGGALNLTSGAGPSSVGRVNFQTGGTTIAYINNLSQLVTTGRRRAVTSLIVTNYDVQTSDDVIALGTNSDTTTITLPPSPTLGDTYTVVDAVGTASTHNVTVAGNGHNINGSSTFNINTNYQSIELIFTGTIWSIV